MSIPTYIASVLPNIIKTLGMGYGSKEILGWLSKNNKAISGQIQSALKQGYNEDQILAYYTGRKHMTFGQKEEALSGMTEKEKGAALEQGAPGDWKKPLATAASIALPVAGTVGAAMALRQSVPGILQGILNPQAAMGTPPAGSAPIGAMPQTASPMTQPAPINLGSAQSPGTQNVPLAGAQANTAPWGHLTPQNSMSIVNAMGLNERIDNLLHAGNTPEAIAAGIGSTLNTAQHHWFSDKLKKGETKPLEEIVKDYISMKPNQVPAQTPGMAAASPMPVPEPVLSQPAPAPETENEVVDTSTGISGKVSAKGKNQAIVDVDGQLHKANTEDLTPIPPELHDLDYKEMARKYKDTFPKTGPGSLSTNVASLAHHAPSNQLYATFVTSPGFVYRYSNVPQELYERIKSQSVAPKTTGTGFLGEWDTSVADSIGGPFYEIKKDPGKYPFDKIPIGYNMMQKFLDAISEQEKAHAKEERARKKLQGH